MKYDAEIAELKAETFALQSIVIGLCNSMPTENIKNAFTFAEIVSEIAVPTLAGKRHAEHVERAGEIIKQLRGIALANKPATKAGV